MVVTTLSDRQVEILQALIRWTGNQQPDFRQHFGTVEELAQLYKTVGRNARPRTTEQQKRGEVVFDNAVWRQVHRTGRTATEDAGELVRQFNAAHPELAAARDNILEASA